MRKKVIILNSYPGARLANQLWNFISIYAYCLEKNFACRNYCFFEEKKHKDKNNRITYKNYYNYFKIPIGAPAKFLITLHLTLAKIWKKTRLYHRFAALIEKTRPGQILYSGEQETFYLPPSVNKNQAQLKKLAEIEFNDKIYLSGWLFKNPAGLVKYRKEITAYFKPKDKIQKKVNSLTAELKSKFKHLVGVHIRQGDYKIDFRGGELYFDEKSVANLLRSYLKNFNKNKAETVFIICSDGTINMADFSGLNAIKSDFNAVDDLFLLAAADIIIGSDSTFGALASYFGNLPFIVFNRPLDWNFYKDKKYFFENKKCTTAHF